MAAVEGTVVAFPTKRPIRAGGSDLDMIIPRVA